MKKRRISRGRPRKAGPRQPNGQPSRAKAIVGPTISPELLAKRASIVGIKQQENAKAGTVLGRLHLAGKITLRQYEAGYALAGFWMRWARMASCPSRHATAIGGSEDRQGAPVPWEALTPREQKRQADRWGSLVAEMGVIRRHLRSTPAPALALSLLESVCVDDIMPLRLESDWLCRDWPQGWQLLRDALDLMAEHFKVPAGREMEVA